HRDPVPVSLGHRLRSDRRHRHGRDADLHRAVRGGIRVRLEERGPRVGLNLIQVSRGHDKDGDLGLTLTTLEKAVNWARTGSRWARAPPRATSTTATAWCRAWTASCPWTCTCRGARRRPKLCSTASSNYKIRSCSAGCSTRNRRK